MTDAASEILGKHRHENTPWITNELLGMCGKRKELMKGKSTSEGVEKYRDINTQNVRTRMKEVQGNLTGELYSAIEDNLNKNNSKRAFQIVKNLTNENERISIIQDKSGKKASQMKGKSSIDERVFFRFF